VLPIVYVMLCLPSIAYYVVGLRGKSEATFGYDKTAYVVEFIELCTIISNPLIYTGLSPSFIRQVKSIRQKQFGQYSD